MGAGFNIIALLSAVQPVGYIFSALIYRSLPRDVYNVDIILFSNLMIVGAYLLSGPSDFFDLIEYSQIIPVIFVGHIMKGLFTPFIFLPVLPEMIKSV